jgi:tetratricopeptide (TPR) repeat protein
MLLGNILQTEPQMVLTSQLVEVSNGKVLASQRITGKPEEQIFPLVDRLTVEVKKDLSLPDEAHQEWDPEIANVTTHSAEAYRHYVEGIEYLAKVYTLEGERSMRKALEHDSTFAMAYYQLANITHVQNRRELISEAMKYIEKVSRKEKMYIESMNALLYGEHDQAIEILEEITKRYPDEKFAYSYLGIIYSNFVGDHEKTVAALRRAIEIDPLYRPAYNWMAYQYDIVGDLEQSIWAINKYIELAPGEANPYDTRADIYANNGKIASAIESYQQALEIKPDFHVSREKLGHMYLFFAQYAKAESTYRELTACSEKLIRSGARTFLAVVPLYQGKLTEALRILEHGVVADEMEASEARLDDKHFVRATIYREQNNMNAALREIETATEVSHRTDHYLANQWRLHWIQYLIESGDLEKARSVIDDIEQQIPGTPVLVKNFYWCAMGLAERAEGHPQEAFSFFEKVAPAEYHFYTHYLVARVYLQQGKLAESVSAFENLLSRYDRVRTLNAIASVKAHYYLGQAYERSGWTDKAIEQYETFLEIWKDADEGIGEVEKARERMEALRART